MFPAFARPVLGIRAAAGPSSRAADLYAERSSRGPSSRQASSRRPSVQFWSGASERWRAVARALLQRSPGAIACRRVCVMEQ
jgi:hypothetical protein